MTSDCDDGDGGDGGDGDDDGGIRWWTVKISRRGCIDSRFLESECWYFKAARARSFAAGEGERETRSRSPSVAVVAVLLWISLVPGVRGDFRRCDFSRRR